MTTSIFPSRRIACILATAIFLASAIAAPAVESVKRKGRFLKTEIERYEDKTSYVVTLDTTPASSFMTFKFTRIALRTIHEIKVFETVVDTINTNADDAQNVRDYRALKILPNEYIRDNPTTRETTIVQGPLANTQFTLDGIAITTDKDGLYVDSKQIWLAKFDNLTLNAVDIAVEHANYGSQTVQLTRFIFRPEEKILPDYKRDDPNATLDILQGMGRDFAKAENPGRTTYKLECQVPETYTLNGEFPVTIKVTNLTANTAGNLFFCTFSREDWLDGKLFYIGNLKGGESQSFTRLFKAPAAAAAEKSHFLISSWDTVRAMPEKAVHFTLKLNTP